jgi:hypothetical protein
LKKKKKKKNFMQKKFWLEHGALCKDKLEKIISVGQGKQKYPARKCRARKKRGGVR